ncbi:MAG: hypothetical protein RR144_05730 [Clostridia bacterium]
MKKKKRNILLTIIVITITITIIVTIAILIINLNKEKINNTVDLVNKQQEYEQNKNDMYIKETENLVVSKDGKISLKQAKEVVGLKIDNITVSYINGQTEIKGTIKNDTLEKINADFVKINIKDVKGNIFRTIDVYLGEVAPNSSKELNVTTQADISNIKDLEFIK